MSAPATSLAPPPTSLDNFTADLFLALHSPTTPQSSLAITRAFTLILRAHNLSSHLRITLLHEHDSQQSSRDQVTCATDFSMHDAEAGEMVPVAWAVKGGMVVPVEYFPGWGRAAGIDFEGAMLGDFVREFVGVVRECGLEGVVGLRLVR
ncbi:hypothetical protein VC83_03680 [Pseudogymnoascus destructans]|uniref:Uncharacterized protein n=1 Tax=Pseudogymnoascus destructans TaxID=655981 RepID=A0A177ABX7_9PEZI|nr:uncharacterized protein VC83_03680 [Pseudogymnoascus destructans]OAF59606.1 hypothetical protein VC83_03680 [Pseudogymnoascus destructans]